MPEVAAMLGGRIADLAFELLGEPTSRTCTEWRFRKRGSLAVVIGGMDRGKWFDHEAGYGGDALALVAHLRHGPMAEAWRWALGWLGIREGVPQPPRRSWPVAPLERIPERHHAERKAWSLAKARELWRQAGPAVGTLVEAYLAARGLVLEPGAPLRFHPAAWRNRAYGSPGPAMVSLMTCPETGKPCGLHVTYLRADGAGKAEGTSPKIFLGVPGVVRLVPDTEVTMGLGLTEGIETGLSVMQRYDWAPVWAAGSADGIARFPALPGITGLHIFPDADDKGTSLKAAGQCADRWRAAGREVWFITPPSQTDFADLAGRAA
jgi:hypothetical protein